MKISASFCTDPYLDLAPFTSRMKIRNIIFSKEDIQAPVIEHVSTNSKMRLILDDLGLYLI